jgi:hypothetical protein
VVDGYRPPDVSSNDRHDHAAVRSAIQSAKERREKLERERELRARHEREKERREREEKEKEAKEKQGEQGPKP